MDDVVLARHGESETAAAGVVGGDAGLTERGREQARRLGERLASRPIDVCLVSPARRARETAEIALAGRSVPLEVLAELDDIGFGSFDGGTLVDYRTWVAANAPSEAPPNGESRVATLRRFARALRTIAARPERCALVVAHGLLLRAATGERPEPAVAGVPYGASVRVAGGDLVRAAERLDAWCELPSW
jgi:broad specificity phosphatase PhoE